VNPDRTRIVDALATVPGLTPTPATPDTITEGAAFPKWIESRFSSGKLSRPMLHTFDVIVVLPAGYNPDTVDAADGLVPQVMAALAGIASVDLAEPVQLTFPAGTSPSLPGLRIRCTPQPERTLAHAYA